MLAVPARPEMADRGAAKDGQAADDGKTNNVKHEHRDPYPAPGRILEDARVEEQDGDAAAHARQAVDVDEGVVDLEDGVEVVDRDGPHVDARAELPAPGGQTEEDEEGEEAGQGRHVVPPHPHGPKVSCREPEGDRDGGEDGEEDVDGDAAMVDARFDPAC